MDGPAPRDLRPVFRPEWDPGADDGGRRGFLAPDPRVRTLLRVRVSYDEVRYVVPDRVSLEGTSDPRRLEVLTRFIERQRWLCSSVSLR
jgi:hypothetical protein